jgi:hypothetical protein
MQKRIAQMMYVITAFSSRQDCPSHTYPRPNLQVFAQLDVQLQAEFQVQPWANSYRRDVGKFRRNSNNAQL